MDMPLLSELTVTYQPQQFPSFNLFARAMEGASPSSALGYGALSAHSGLVLLALTKVRERKGGGGGARDRKRERKARGGLF